jgi:NADH-quinone oxidoreductase subunit C
MAPRILRLSEAIKATLSGKLTSITDALGEVTFVIPASSLIDAMTALRDDPGLACDQ